MAQHEFARPPEGGVAAFLKEAAKPEWFIKTAIVYLGIKIGGKLFYEQ